MSDTAVMAGAAFITLTLDDAKLRAGLERATSQLEKFQKSVEIAVNQIGRATTFMTYPIVKSIQTFAQFDDHIDGFVTGLFGTVDLLQQELYAAAGQLLCILAYGRKPGGQIFAKLQTVKTHNGYISRNPQTVVVQRPDSADGHYVRFSK